MNRESVRNLSDQDQIGYNLSQGHRGQHLGEMGCLNIPGTTNLIKMESGMVVTYIKI